MSEPVCIPCKELGYNVVAHYQGVPAGSSTNGKSKPPECYYHHFGMPLPRSITGKLSTTKEVDIVSKVKPEQPEPLPEHSKSKCACGCGQALPPGYRWNYIRGHRKSLRAEVNYAMKESQPKDSSTSATVTITPAFLDRWWMSLTFTEKLNFFKEQWKL